ADTFALETQVYQAILERRPAPVIPRLKEILAKPDPTLGYFNGDLRFWLGWAQDVAGDHAAAQESWRQARTELEPFLKEQPESFHHGLHGTHGSSDGYRSVNHEWILMGHQLYKWFRFFPIRVNSCSFVV